MYLCLAALYISTAVVWTFKSNIALASYCRSYLIFRRNIRISNLLPILVCDMCYHARKINSFPCKGQINKSRIFRISQGKFNCFKDVRGGWHIPAYSLKLNMFHWQKHTSMWKFPTNSLLHGYLFLMHVHK